MKLVVGSEVSSAPPSLPNFLLPLLSPPFPSAPLSAVPRSQLGRPQQFVSQVVDHLGPVVLVQCTLYENSIPQIKESGEGQSYFFLLLSLNI